MGYKEQENFEIVKYCYYKCTCKMLINKEGSAMKCGSKNKYDIVKMIMAQQSCWSCSFTNSHFLNYFSGHDQLLVVRESYS